MKNPIRYNLRFYCGIAVLPDDNYDQWNNSEAIAFTNRTSELKLAIPFFCFANSSTEAHLYVREFFRAQRRVDTSDLIIVEIAEGPQYAMNEGLIHSNPEDGLVQEAFMPLLVDTTQTSKTAAVDFVRECSVGA